MAPINVKKPTTTTLPTSPEFTKLKEEVEQNRREILAFAQQVRDSESKLETARLAQNELERKHLRLRWETLAEYLNPELIDALTPKHRPEFGCSDSNRKDLTTDGVGTEEFNCTRCVLLTAMDGDWFDCDSVDFNLVLKDRP